MAVLALRGARAWSRAPRGTVLEGLGRVPARWAIAPVIGLAIGSALSTIQLWDLIWYQRGTDYGFYVAQAQRFLDGGGFYTAHQLAGAYAVGIGVDNVYPPPALLLFLPFVVLPGPLWWLIPVAVVAAVVVAFRPAPWTWPLLGLACWFPRTESIVIWGNTTMWVVAFVALGLRFAWPSILVLLKPYFALLALIGFRNRSWRLGVLAFAAINVLLLPLWADFLAAWRNAGPSWPSLGYSPGDVVALSIPVIAWAGRRAMPPIQDAR